MKNLLFVFVLLLCFNLTNGQTKQYNSYASLSQSNEFKTRTIDRTVIVYDSAITISSYKGGGTKDLILEINNIATKEYDGSIKKYTWYYCTDAEKDEIYGHQKYIVIVLFDKIVVTRFADEVTIFQNTLLLD